MGAGSESRNSANAIVALCFQAKRSSDRVVAPPSFGSRLVVACGLIVSMWNVQENVIDRLLKAILGLIFCLGA